MDGPDIVHESWDEFASTVSSTSGGRSVVSSGATNGSIGDASRNMTGCCSCASVSWSTGIGGGVGIPHGKLAELEKPLLGFGVSHQGVDFDAIDQRPVHLFFILLTPSNATGIHLGLLARISRLLKDDTIKTRLQQADSPQAVRSIIAENDIDD